MRRLRIPELVVGAGDSESARLAFHYGADAVYVGLADFNLRKRADGFSNKDLEKLLLCADEFSCYESDECRPGSTAKKVYLAANSVLKESELESFQKALGEALEVCITGRNGKKRRVDAVIVSDAGAFDTVREISDVDIHISTQMSVSNSRAVNMWKERGAKRIILSRELSLADIAEIRKKTTAEIECFVHGALCISYSGRCFLSSFMEGRSSNEGDCSQPCRWSYRVETGRLPGEWFPVEESEEGTFIFNSRDLNMLSHLDKLMAAGVDAFKIEGRLKGIHYVSVVTNAYRRAIDYFAGVPEASSTGFMSGPIVSEISVDEENESGEFISRLQKELETVSNRGYTTGFYFGRPSFKDYSFDTGQTRKSYRPVALVLDCRPARNGLFEALLSVRNNINIQYEYDVVTSGEVSRVKVLEMKNEEGMNVESSTNQKTVTAIVDGELRKNDLLRKECTD